ncbi:hypothetical protein HCU64_10185 [Methylobacterium sp. C25]|uniref:PilZ domain-containing protein n=1 Tax=Methylobacterium sp. C25 TaxID=2721622 RepID=UPI001F2686C3|nr:PilZ domain-containing protein [Methylobacterium sp. C25]MCE4224120.1 hypothetical protein [Methylobacterium sp. C25]
MIERRRRPRVRVDSVGHIITKKGNPIACRVVDRSPDGARLFVDSVFGIPNEFRLVIQKTSESFTTNVVWRSPQELGVAFVETHGVMALTPGNADREPIDLAQYRGPEGFAPEPQGGSLISGATCDI